MAEIVCLGEALIDFVAAESGVGVGEASGFLRAPGGAPANVAVGVARLGRTSAFVGKVGDDPFGRFLAKTFSEAGVDVGGMVFDSRLRTGLAFVSLGVDGERDFCFFRNPSADMTFAVEELDRSRIAAGTIFHFGSITLIDRPARETTLAAVHAARGAGLLVSYDPNIRPALWPSPAAARKTIFRAIPHADIVKVSAEELTFLMLPDTALASGDTVTQELVNVSRRFLSRFPNVRLLVVTLGVGGCLVLRARTMLRMPGYRVRAVDTTGAGDGFVAGMLVGLLDRGLTTAARLANAEPDAFHAIFELANAVGALTTTAKGAIPALPTAKQAHALRTGGARRDVTML